jgi:competence ComEA-like helix-hairpin-helix protein
MIKWTRKGAKQHIGVSRKNQRGLIMILLGVGCYGLIPLILITDSKKEILLKNYNSFAINYIERKSQQNSKVNNQWVVSPNKYRNDPDKPPTNIKAIISRPPSKTSQKTDLNSADSQNLVKLPGIGPTLSARIIKYRNKLGGFYTREQLKEVYGIPDSTYEKIKMQLEVQPTSIKKICLNLVDEKTIATHPYVGWNDAKIIIRYRQANGYFKNAEDLASVWAMDKKNLERLLPYLSFDTTHK